MVQVRDATSGSLLLVLRGHEHSVYTAGFSPDGAQVAFHWDGPQQDNVDVYVKAVGGGEPLRLTTDPEAELAPAWSPDGSRLAFLKVSANPIRTDVMVMPARA